MILIDSTAHLCCSCLTTRPETTRSPTSTKMIPNFGSIPPSTILWFPSTKRKSMMCCVLTMWSSFLTNLMRILSISCTGRMSLWSLSVIRRAITCWRNIPGTRQGVFWWLMIQEILGRIRYICTDIQGKPSTMDQMWLTTYQSIGFPQRSCRSSQK